MASKRISKKPVVNILVSSGNQALASGALNTSGAAFNIANGQLGVVSATTNGTIALDSFITAGTTATNVDKIRVVQGTPASADFTKADIWEVGPKPLNSSGVIAKDSIVSVTTKKLSVPNYSAQAFTNLPSNLVAVNKTFGANVSILSVRKDRDYSRNTDVVYASTTTPASLTGITDTLDYTLQRFLYNLNAFSQKASFHGVSSNKGNKPFVAFAINTAGGDGVVLSSITNGTSIPFMKEYTPGVSTNLTSAFVADMAFVKTLALLISGQSDITGASTIELIDVANAGTAANVDAFVVVGLADSTSAYFDDITQTLADVRVNLTGAFRTSPYLTETKIQPYEGMGKGRDWSIESKSRAQLQVHTNQNHPFNEFFSEGYPLVDPTKDYSATIIEYFDYEDTLTLQVKSPKKLIILLPATVPTITVSAAVTNIGNSVTPVPSSTTDSTTVTGLNASLGAWLISALPSSGHAVLGDATLSTYFA